MKKSENNTLNNCIGCVLATTYNRGYNQRLEMLQVQNAAARSLKTLYATSRIDAPNKTNLETDNSHFETRKPEK